MKLRSIHIAIKASISAVSLFLFSITASHAEPKFNILDKPTLMPWHPHISVYGNAGTVRSLGGQVLIPTVGSNNSVLYIDSSGKYGSDNAWYSAYGLGVRQLFKHNIIGLYVYGDRNVSPHKKTFWMISPGAELITVNWNAHVDAYIPYGNRNKTLQSGIPGENIGIYKEETFSGHSKYDHLFEVAEEVGTGFDVYFEHKLPTYHPLSLYVGGYYYDFRHLSDIRGVQLGLRFPILKHFEIKVADSYDKIQGNVATLGLSLFLGGMPRHTAGTLADHLLDFTHRHLGTLERGDATRSGKFVRDTTHRVLILDNIFFFDGQSNFTKSSTANIENNQQDTSLLCTAEHPCHADSLNQSIINEISAASPNANLYISPGTYNLTGVDNRLHLHSGQKLFGRSIDYREPANLSSSLPIIKGYLSVDGNNTIDSIKLENNGADNLGAALNIINANNVTITNSMIGDAQGVGSYIEAADIQNSTGITIANSVIRAFMLNKFSGANSTAINISNSQLTIDNSQLFSVHDITDASLAANESVYAIYGEQSHLTINNSKIESTMNVDVYDKKRKYSVYGVANTYPDNNPVESSTTITNSTVNTNGLAADGVLQGKEKFTIRGLYLRGKNIVKDSMVNLNMDGDGTAYGYEDNGTQVGSSTDILHSEFNITANGTNNNVKNTIYGINPSSVINNINGDTVNITNKGGTGVRNGYGVYVNQSNTNTTISNSIFNISDLTGSKNVNTYGVYANKQLNGVIVDVDNSTFNLMGTTGDGKAFTYGVRNRSGNNAAITVKTSNFDIRSDSSAGKVGKAKATNGIVNFNNNGNNVITENN